MRLPMLRAEAICLNSPTSLNAAISRLKFFFEVTLSDADRMARMR